MRPFEALGHIDADWPAPPHVHAGSTTRLGGFSPAPFDGLNLGLGSGDDSETVWRNRRHLAAGLGLAVDPVWLDQQHGIVAIDADAGGHDRRADASFTFQPGAACAVLTADCLPVLFCDRAGTRVAAAHAGWRGLAHGVLESVLARLRLPPEETRVWLGPAIGPQRFEVGPEVRAAFAAADPGAGAAFRPGRGGRVYADLFALARRRLALRGVTAVYGGGVCAYDDPQRFFSYRRDGGRTGRMASLIWIQRSPGPRNARWRNTAPSKSAPRRCPNNAK